ncbi:MAG: PIG-L deacetylase family protein [Puia sp.]
METSSRRGFVKQVAGSIGITSLPSLLAAQHADPAKTLKIVCVGGHPDDPESGCGGTLAKFTASGHAVTIIYLTRGEAGIPGKSHSEAAAIRSEEAMKSCTLLKAKPLFAGQIDGDTVINKEWINKMQALIEGEKPDIVFAHWPVDFHVDHQNASILVIQTWMRAKNKFDLYFFEVCTGEQTMGFKPTDYVNITDTQEQKRKAVYCHVSQDPPGIYECGHKAMESFRGRENGTPAAEAYIRMTGMEKGNYFNF